MIRRVWSDLATFKEVRFESGFNVVLADAAEDSKETESTNGLGKTTLIRIIHFCLGSDLSRDKVLTHPDLAGLTFGLDLQIGDRIIVASRNISTPKTVSVSASFLDGLAVDAEVTGGDLATISLEDWKNVLSERFCPEAAVSTAALRKSFVPSFRELAIYFIRLGKPAFVDPQLAYQGQSGPSKRLSLSFMLGLNWGLQRSIHEQIESRGRLKEATTALRDPAVSGHQTTIGELEAERVALEKLLTAKQKEVESFNVRDDYRQLESDLNAADREIHERINENHADTRLRDCYLESANQVPDADSSRPISILEGAGAVFQANALRTLEDVSTFHAEVYRNRKEFLQGEIARLNSAIEARTAEITIASRKKQQILGLLRTSGAIETLITLQRSYTELNARHQVLLAQIEQRKRFDRRRDEIAATIARDKMLLKSDLDDRRHAVDEVRALFAEYTQTLYGRPGRLAVDVGKDGYSFTFTIDREGSDGIDQMVVFCFDLTVATLWAKYNRGLPILIHDSSLFADVDPRQYAGALKLAAECSAKFGFQYICCLNSGTLPLQHLGDFDLTLFVRLRLTDEGPSGRLLGTQLPPREKRAAA
jgi:uncharacterized protein YydD (DUF2326 family)